jgi:GT2 family glycosyltransferase
MGTNTGCANNTHTSEFPQLQRVGMHNRSASPQVSVILPVYNAAPFLEECLRSLTEQSMDDFEIIAVDDGSTDSSPDILSSHKALDRRLLVRRQENQGGAAARNCAIYEARAPFIALMDADDIALPNRLEAQWRCLKQQKDLSVLGGDMAVLDERGRTTRVLAHPTHPSTIARSLLATGGGINDPTVMIRRSDFMSVGGYRELLRSAYDYDLWLRMLLAGFKFANLPELLVRYRQHANQTTARYSALTRVVPVLAQASYRALGSGEPDPIERWDGSHHLASFADIGLSPFELAVVHARLLEGPGAMPEALGESRESILESLWRLDLRGPTPATGFGTLWRASRAFSASGHRVRGLRFRARCVWRGWRLIARTVSNRLLGIPGRRWGT